jgi:hypothetical protein
LNATFGVDGKVRLPDNGLRGINQIEYLFRVGGRSRTYFNITTAKCICVLFKEVSFITNLNWILAVIGVELLFRIIKKTRVIPVDSFFIYLAGITVLLASYLETMRFGFIGLFFTFCGFTALYLFWSYGRLGGRKTVAIAALFILSFTAIGYANIKADRPR